MEADIVALMSLPDCTLLPQFAIGWSTGNSTVLSVPAVTAFSLFPASGKVTVTASLVAIRGYSPEPLHFHTSHLIGVVVSGIGNFAWSADGAEQTAEVGTGDVVVIPRGAPHFFNCAPGGSLDYIALEISDGPIDYQKHFH